MLMMALGGRGTRRQRPHLESVITACHLHPLFSFYLLVTTTRRPFILNLLVVRSRTDVVISPAGNQSYTDRYIERRA